MKIQEILISRCMTEPNKYFLFKDNGLEIVFFIVGNRIHSDSYITKEEKEYIKKHYIKNQKEKTLKEKVISLRLKDYSYHAIAEELSISVGSAHNIINK